MNIMSHNLTVTPKLLIGVLTLVLLNGCHSSEGENQPSATAAPPPIETFVLQKGK